jgi:hypothetical protein
VQTWTRNRARVEVKIEGDDQTNVDETTIRFDSFSGNVTATLPFGAGVVIETSEGTLDTTLPVQIEQIGDDRVRATLGDGGPRLHFDTYSDTLSVRSR